MNYEVNDYRKPPPQPVIGPWLTYHVPAPHIPDYFLNMFLLLFFLPWIIGIQLTSLGLLLQFLIIDLWIWFRLKKAYGQE
jgi:hypothetical protein